MGQRIVFISNYLSPHQKDICEQLFKKAGKNFKFIATCQTPKFRIQLGYSDLNNIYPFVFKAYESAEARTAARKICEECDVLIEGSAPDWFFHRRLLMRKLTFKFGERFFKTPFSLSNVFRRTGSMFIHNIPFQNSNYYLLCANSYMPNDCALYHLFPNRIFKWAYFTELYKYDNVYNLVDKKESNSILWVGRMISWKHPEAAVEAAKLLKENGYDFTLKMIGTGGQLPDVVALIAKYSLQDNVKLLGTMPIAQVREEMEKSEIFLSTSDFEEGWGAVLNEAMNSACAAVATKQAGSTLYLIRDGINGIVTDINDIATIYSGLSLLLDNKERRREFAINAYNDIVNVWNADVATDRLLSIISEIQSGKGVSFYESGVCSKAEKLDI